MQTKKLFNISQQDFVIMDYDKSNLLVTIAVSDFNDTDEIKLTQADVCECAQAFGLIDHYRDPVYDNDNFEVEVDDCNADFIDWWDDLAPDDAEKIFSAAIATKVDIKLDTISKELFQAATAA